MCSLNGWAGDMNTLEIFFVSPKSRIYEGQVTSKYVASGAGEGFGPIRVTY